jgi:hypothetical protein
MQAGWRRGGDIRHHRPLTHQRGRARSPSSRPGLPRTAAPHQLHSASTRPSLRRGGMPSVQSPHPRKGRPMTAHQCPRCKLLFAFRTEVEWLLRNEHRSAVEKEAELRAELRSARELGEAALTKLQSTPAGPSVTLLLGTVPASTMTSLDAARLHRLAHRAADRLQVQPGAAPTATRQRSWSTPGTWRCSAAIRPRRTCRRRSDVRHPRPPRHPATLPTSPGRRAHRPPPGSSKDNKGIWRKHGKTGRLRRHPAVASKPVPPGRAPGKASVVGVAPTPAASHHKPGRRTTRPA